MNELLELLQQVADNNGGDYGTLEEFFDNNPGVISAMEEWCIEVGLIPDPFEEGCDDEE